MNLSDLREGTAPGRQTDRVALDSRDLVILVAFDFWPWGLGEGAAGFNQVDTTVEVTQGYRGARMCLTDQNAVVDGMPTRSPLLR